MLRLCCPAVFNYSAQNSSKNTLFSFGHSCPDCRASQFTSGPYSHGTGRLLRSKLFMRHAPSYITQIAVPPGGDAAEGQIFFPSGGIYVLPLVGQSSVKCGLLARQLYGPPAPFQAAGPNFYKLSGQFILLHGMNPAGFLETRWRAPPAYTGLDASLCAASAPFWGKPFFLS